MNYELNEHPPKPRHEGPHGPEHRGPRHEAREHPIRAPHEEILNRLRKIEEIMRRIEERV